MGKAKGTWEVISTALIAVIIVKIFILQTSTIPTGSMQPTLRGADDFHGIGDRLFVNKFIYGVRIDCTPFADCGYIKLPAFRNPRRGEIVVFVPPLPDAKDAYIKRLIGEPGDKIELRNFIVYINDEPLDEPYTSHLFVRGIPDSGDMTINFGPVVVPPNHYFFMGDNRLNSSDSRVFGFVPADNIVGKAFFMYWPISRMGFIRAHEY